MPLKSSFLKPPSKRQIRQQLQADMDVFIAKGGAVKEVPNGVSAIFNSAPTPYNRRDGNGYGGFTHNGALFTNKPDERTWVPDVVAAIEQRKTSARNAAPNAQAARRSSRQKQWIYDDFGEPIRWVWKD